LLAALAVAAWASSSQAAEPPRFTALVADISPLTIPDKHDPNVVGGLVGELMTGALHMAGIDTQVTLQWRPWKRAQKEFALNPRAMIFPLTRLPEREPSFQWVSLLLTIPCYVYTADPRIIITKTDDLFRVRRVGAFRESPMAVYLRRLYGPAAPEKLEEYDNELANLRKLLAGRIDAWIAPDLVADYYLRKYAEETQGSVPLLRRQMLLMPLPLWLAMNKEASQEDIALLQYAIRQFKTTPAYRAILRKYGQ
jgi:polar amino acid transport system substrate-binding protein